MVLAARSWQSNDSRQNWEELGQAVAAFETWREKIVTYPKEYTDLWWPGHATFCKWIVADLEDTGVASYTTWPQQRAVVQERGLRGLAMGFGTSYYYSFIGEPLTLDLDSPR